MAIQPQPSTGLAVLNEYPPQQFNLLIPMTTLQEISPMHRVTINQVKIDPDVKGKEVYPTDGGLALTRVALHKLMIGANIQVVESKAIMPGKCQRCLEMTKQTKLAARCGDCPCADDVACQVTIAVPDPSGMWRRVTATKELRVEDERGKMTEKQFKQFYSFRTEHCETKALNRALREALAVKSSYQAAELARPFVVAHVSPNYADPTVKASMAASMGDMARLFARPNFEEMAALPAATQTIEVTDVTVMDDDDEPPMLAAPEPAWVPVDVSQELEQIAEPFSPDVIACEACKEIILPASGYTPEQVRSYSQKRYGVTLCMTCQRARSKPTA